MLTTELRQKAAKAIEAMKSAEPADKCETVLAPLDPTYKTMTTYKTMATYKTAATYNTTVLAQDLDPEADANLQAIFPNGELQDGDFRKAAAAMRSREPHRMPVD